jgi:hypothetical protein
VTTLTGDNPSISAFLAWKLSNLLSKRAANAARQQTGIAYTLVRMVLQLAGFALLTLAGFAFSMITGLIVAGISCFVLSTLTTGGKADDANPMNRR